MTPEAANIDDQQVREFLEHHPDFLTKNPGLLAILATPARPLGDGVVDFQQFQVQSLQKNTESLKIQYQSLIQFCRNVIAAQTQTQEAVLRLINVRNLEQLLEVLTVDLTALFDVDVVRLAVESEQAGLYETYYPEQHYSGIVFITPGAAEALFARGKGILMVEDAAKAPVPAFDEIFTDCDALIASCVLLRLRLERMGADALLGFGVRHKGRFRPDQPGDTWLFIARVVATLLDRFLHETTE